MSYSAKMISNIKPHSDIIDQQFWKRAYHDWLHDFDFTHGITLSWNRTVSITRAHADLKTLLRRIDRKLLGPNFNKFPAVARTEAYFVFEGYDRDHVHVHSLWRAPQGKRIALGKMFPRKRGGVWNAVVSHGSYDVCQWFGGQRNDDITGYIMKEQHRFSDIDTTVWASDFHRAR